MKNALKVFCAFLTLAFISCGKGKHHHKPATIMEITTFKTQPFVDATIFKKRDAEIEKDFTSKQPGFIKRQSGINEKGEYVVIVFWNSTEEAEASMNKFMSDKSVMDYAQMIDGPSMKMTRFGMDKAYDAKGTEFVEVMTFKPKEGVNPKKLYKTNRKVEKEFTGTKKGFLQRLIGFNENGTQAVAVYWDSKANSDAVIKDFMAAPIAGEFMSFIDQQSIFMGRYELLPYTTTNKEKTVALLNSFNTGDKKPISYINPKKYIQHNLDVPDGLQGFGEIMKHAPPQGFKADVIRAFEDGEYVFTHTKYDFFGPKVGFDVFRFENGQIVEHWDNLLPIQKPNPSGRTQLDGEVKITDLEKTGTNKQIVKDFIQNVIINHEMDKLTTYINPKKYIQHNPAVADGLEGFGAAMQYFAKNGLVLEYSKLHKVLGQGNFVLTISEGKFGKGDHTAFYDLFRLENNQIVEHWDVIATIPPKSNWKNNNGKF